jgi:hypothetical protein
MLPGIPPFHPISLLLTLAAFVGGAILWYIMASYGGIWQRMRLEPETVYKLLTRQISIAVGATALMIILGLILGDPLGNMFRWLSTVGGMVFWAYLGALAVTAARRASADKKQ